MSQDRVAAFLNEAPLVLLPQAVLTLGIGTAVPDQLVASREERGRDLRTMIQHRSVDIVRTRDREIVEQV